MIQICMKSQGVVFIWNINPFLACYQIIHLFFFFIYPTKCILKQDVCAGGWMVAALVHRVTSELCSGWLGGYMGRCRAEQLLALNLALDPPHCLWLPMESNVSYTEIISQYPSSFSFLLHAPAECFCVYCILSCQNNNNLMETNNLGWVILQYCIALF